MFHYTADTKNSVEDTVASLEANLKEEQFGVLWDFDVKTTLENKGLSFDSNYRVLEVCNPKAAKEILETDKLVGYFLPCKIVVYEDGDRTKIGMPKPTVLMDIVGNDNLTKTAEDIEKRLVACIDNSV